MTVFVSHAPADAAVAEDLEKFLERRGQFAECDDGQTALRPVQPSDVVVLLLSKDFVFAPTRLRLEQRALDAWADGRLIIVRLDKGMAPVGLRDLPALDASFEAQREFKWQELASAIRDKLRAPVVRSDDGEDEALPPARPRRKAGRLWSAVALLVLALPGVGAFVVAGAIWLANRIGPTPGGWDELRLGVDDFGVRYGLAAGVTPWLFLAAILASGAIFAWFVTSIVLSVLRPKRSATAPAQTRAEAPAENDATFVSYARANQGVVLPVIEAAQETGRKFWLDQQGITAGDGWAGEIVRAIRSAAGVVVMCSKAAFESDHVKREIYLADRYRKKLTPIFIEKADPPEDFEYFFAGVQTVDLFETPEGERPAALLRALGAAS